MMRITLDRLELVAALALVKSVADRTATMPILSKTRLLVKGKTLSLAASDLNVSLTTSVGKGKNPKVGSVAVAAKALHDIAKKMDGDDVLLEFEGKAESEGGQLLVRSASAEFKLAVGSAADFPKLPDTPEDGWSSIATSDLADHVARVRPAMSPDITRPHLHAMLWEDKGGSFGFTATDGHRLSRSVFEWGDAAPATPKGGVLVPVKGMAEIAKLLKACGTDEVEVQVGNKEVFVRAGATTLAAKIVDAQFPPYEQVIPKGNSRIAIVPRDRLIATLERLVLVTDNAGGIHISTAAKGIQFRADNKDSTMFGRENVAATIEGEKVKGVGLNATYLLELLAVMDCEQVRIEMGDDEVDPVVVRPTDRDDHLVIVMPMRI